MTTADMKKIADAIRRGADLVKGRKVKRAWMKRTWVLGTGEELCLCAQTAFAAGVSGVITSHPRPYSAAQALLEIPEDEFYRSNRFAIHLAVIERLIILNDFTELSLYEIADLVESGEALDYNID